MCNHEIKLREKENQVVAKKKSKTACYMAPDFSLKKIGFIFRPISLYNLNVSICLHKEMAH